MSQPTSTDKKKEKYYPEMFGFLFFVFGMLYNSILDFLSKQNFSFLYDLLIIIFFIIIYVLISIWFSYELKGAIKK